MRQGNKRPRPGSERQDGAASRRALASLSKAAATNKASGASKIVTVETEIHQADAAARDR
jgi:hypothetical protein